MSQYIRAQNSVRVLRQTDGLALVRRKIAELTEQVGPPVKAEDDKGACSGEGWTPVPIEVR